MKPRKLTVQVTQADLANGTRQNPKSCPIALACTRLGYLPDIRAGQFVLTCKETGISFKATPPQVADVFIRSYDDSANPSPFTFEIELNDLV